MRKPQPLAVVSGWHPAGDSDSPFAPLNMPLQAFDLMMKSTGVKQNQGCCTCLPVSLVWGEADWKITEN